MLPLHITFRDLFYTSSVIIFLASCTNESKSDLRVINALNESIENSNKAVNASTTDLMVSLEDKMRDYSTQERAMVWFPKAQMIQKISKNALDQIEEIKVRLEEDQNNTINQEDILNVYNCLIKYKSELLQIDPKLTNEFQQYLKIFTRTIDSSSENQIKMFREYFSGASTPRAKAMLTKLQNNIKINEEGIVGFCHEHCYRFCGLGSSSISTLIGLDRGVVEPGGVIELVAGVGEFNKQYTPEIFVYGKPVSMKRDDVLASHKIKVSAKPGKYYVPVKINYTDQNGIKQSIHKEIEYTVANVQKQ
jgi:gliding motility-associated GldM-like protein